MIGRSGSSRRRLALALALAALIATAGCADFLGSGGDASSSEAANLDSVPDAATVVTYVDVDEMAGDDSLRSVANTALEAQAAQSEYASGPASVSGVLAAFENQTGLSPTKVDDVTFFGTVPEAGSDGAGTAETQQSGMIVSAAFSESELVAALQESGYQPTEQSYEGTTMYTYGLDGQRALAVLGDGTFAMGNVAAVESVVDVRTGNAEALQGELRERFTSTDDGYVRFAASVPQDQLPVGELQTDAPVDPSTLNTVQYVTGSLSTSGDTVTATVNLVDATTNSATRTHDLVQGGLAYYEGTVPEHVRPALEAVTVEQHGNTVTVSVSEDATRIEEIITTLYSSS